MTGLSLSYPGKDEECLRAWGLGAWAPPWGYGRDDTAGGDVAFADLHRRIVPTAHGEHSVGPGLHHPDDIGEATTREGDSQRDTLPDVILVDSVDESSPQVHESGPPSVRRPLSKAILGLRHLCR